MKKCQLKQVSFLIVLTLYVLIGNTSYAVQPVLTTKDYILIKNDPSIQDYTPVVFNVLTKAKVNGIKKILFEKGTYHFYNDKAFEKYCYISNHDNGLRKIAFPLFGFKDFVFDGGGAMFLFHGPIIPFMIEDSENIRIENLSVNWERTFSSELEVIATDSIKRTIDFKISEDYPYQIEDGNLVFIRKDYTHTLETGIYWDPKTKAPAFNTTNHPSMRIFKGTFSAYNPRPEPDLYKTTENNRRPLSIKAIQLASGKVRVSDVDGKLPKVGWFYVCKGHNAENRISPAISVFSSKKLDFRNITMHHAGGMGVIFEKSEDITLNAFNVKRTENSTRMISTTADATHFVNCRGLVKIENCVFENMLDDATNIHGTYVEVTNIISPTVVEVKLSHFQQKGFHFASANDTLAIVDKKSFAHKKNLVLKEMVKVNGTYQQLVFNQDITEIIKTGDLIDNISWHPEVIIRNNRSIDNRARGFLIATPKKVIIENNIFSNMMSAILFEASRFSHWYESGNPQDVTIRNNTFLDCTYGAAGRQGIIEIHSQAHGVVKNIRIIDNEFKSFSPNVVKAEGVENITFTGNKIIESKNYPTYQKPEAILNLKNCTGVNVKGNKVKGFSGFSLLKN